MSLSVRLMARHHACAGADPATRHGASRANSHESSCLCSRHRPRLLPAVRPRLTRTRDTYRYSSIHRRPPPFTKHRRQQACVHARVCTTTTHDKARRFPMLPAADLPAALRSRSMRTARWPPLPLPQPHNEPARGRRIEPPCDPPFPGEAVAPPSSPQRFPQSQCARLRSKYG